MTYLEKTKWAQHSQTISNFHTIHHQSSSLYIRSSTVVVLYHFQLQLQVHKYQTNQIQLKQTKIENAQELGKQVGELLKHKSNNSYKK